jgi:mannose-1-phosphate guanylyltransferase
MTGTFTPASATRKPRGPDSTPVTGGRLRPADLDAVVLAGGLGTRLRGVLPDRPKVLAPVAGRPFLDHLLDWLAAQGARRVVLALGVMADQVLAHLGRRAGHWPGLRLDPVVEPAPLGTGGALAFCRGRLTSDPVLVLNGDSFVDVDLGAFVGAWPADGASAALVAVEIADASRYGRLELSRAGRVQRFLEKTPAPGAAWVNAGLYILAAELLAALPPGRPSSLERDLLESLPAGSIAAWRCRGRFIDIGTPASLAAAPAVLAASRARIGRSP